MANPLSLKLEKTCKFFTCLKVARWPIIVFMKQLDNVSEIQFLQYSLPLRNNSKTVQDSIFKPYETQLTLDQRVNFIQEEDSNQASLSETASALISYVDLFEKGISAAKSGLEERAPDMAAYLSFLSGSAPIAKLFLNGVALEQALVGKNEKVQNDSLKMLSLGLSVIGDLREVIAWTERFGVLFLSTIDHERLQISKPVIKFFSSFIGIIESLRDGSPMKKTMKSLLKFSISSFSLYANLFKNDRMKQLINPLTILTDLINDAMVLQTQSKRLMEKGSSRSRLLKLSTTLSSMALASLKLAALGVGEAAQIPLILYALTAMNVGSQAVLHAGNYFGQINFVVC